MYTIALVVIIAGATFINNILCKYWKPVKIWLPNYLAEPQPRFMTQEETTKIAPTLDKK